MAVHPSPQPVLRRDERRYPGVSGLGVRPVPVRYDDDSQFPVSVESVSLGVVPAHSHTDPSDAKCLTFLVNAGKGRRHDFSFLVNVRSDVMGWMKPAVADSGLEVEAGRSQPDRPTFIQQIVRAPQPHVMAAACARAHLLFVCEVLPTSE